MSRKTWINWTGFSKLRDEETHKIEGAKCMKCKKIIVVITEKRLESHRLVNAIIKLNILIQWSK